MRLLATLIAVELALGGVLAYAQNSLVGGIGAGETAGGLGGAIGFGIVAGTVGSAPPPPTGCNGVIDFSTGCTMGMIP